MKGLNKREIGERINRLRKESGIPAEEFYVQVGKIQQTFSSMERGINLPSAETLNSIASLCNVTTDYILTGQSYTHQGMDQNQSFVGMRGLDNVQTPLARNMFKSINQLSSGIKKFDGLVVDIHLLKSLEKTASTLSISSDMKIEIKNVQEDKVRLFA